MKTNKLVLYIIIMILVASSVFALGVAPARKILTFEENKKETVEIRIVNNEHKDMVLLVYPKGELADYVKIKESIIRINASQADKSITYEINMPSKFDEPGTLKTDIIIMELPENFADKAKAIVVKDSSTIYDIESGVSISASAAVASQLYVNVPYPGKYAKAKLYVSDGKVGDVLQFTIPIFNFGSEKITSAKATIKILGPTNDEIASIETNEVSIEPNNEGKLTATWKADVNKGKYYITGTVTYDGKTIVVEAPLNLGDKFIEVTDVKVSNFKLGDIAKFEISLENKWNEKIPNVYGDITVSDAGGSILANIKTASIDIEPFAKQTLDAFWDTKGATVGKHQFYLTLHYDERTTEKLIDIYVNIDSIKTEQLTAQVIKSKTSTRDTVLVILVAILIAVNIGWFVYMQKRKKK